MLVVSAGEFKIMRYVFLFLVALVASSYVSAWLNARAVDTPPAAPAVTTTPPVPAVTKAKVPLRRPALLISLDQ